jgi:hypothetical protein
MRELRAVGVDDLAHTGDLRRLRGGRAGIGAGDQHVDVTATGQGRGHGIEGRALDRGVVVFGNNKRGHGLIPFFSNR